ncbi:MAG: 3-deoxy-manno-octulosonate cytidylyltransferase [Mariprofundaceae bacterium]|nr:3-deoxy-manno-octulosonate cytidylyltransferase [Mariprofundaceae bacterium]
MKIAIGIPARYESTRFPGKPLADLAGRPMIAHVIERAKAAGIGEVYIATDDGRIAAVAREYGAEVRMTRPDHNSGTERLAEAMREIDCDVVINVQGDEPLIDPEAIRAVVEPFRHDHTLSMATLAHPIQSDEDFNDPNVVKVVCDAKGHALYFSRAPIPFPRNPGGITDAGPLQHVGLYAYRKEFLLIYPGLTPCETEQVESLEQLRVLHHGYSIAVNSGNFKCIGVDTPEDLARAAKIISAS